ncbi:MAG: CHASE domain-containing protein, partial [bacterium]|nr:CHASE domain-containing protein [bacterium]
PSEPKRTIYAVITYMEPLIIRNLQVLGDDMYIEPVRRAAMEKARDTNATTMSDVVSLRQEDNSRSNGVILYHPIYRKGAKLDTIAQKQAALTGYIHVPVRTDLLFGTILKNNDEFFNFRVFSEAMKNEKTLLYEGEEIDVSDNLTLVDTHTVQNIGQAWDIEYNAAEAIVPASIRDRPQGVIIGGSIFAFIVAAIVLLLLQRRTRMLAGVEEKRLQRAKDDMLSLASHQLRTPATGVKQYLGMVIEGFTGKITKEQEEVLQRAYDSNERQLRIINEFLYLAKAEAERIVITPQKFDLIVFTKQIVNDMEAEIKEAGHTVKLNHSAKLSCVADKHSARMIIENLISNAIKYTPEGGAIEITIKSKDKFAVVAVKDNGVGIAKKHYNKLFQQFSRIPNELTKYTSGSGIGLYLSQVLAKQNHGLITVESEVDQGSCFSAHFPRKSVRNITAVTGK